MVQNTRSVSALPLGLLAGGEDLLKPQHPAGCHEVGRSGLAAAVADQPNRVMLG